MNSVTLEELKSFENFIKKNIIVKYNDVIPKEKASYILEKNYITKENFRKNKSVEKQHGELLRNIFSDLISVENKDLLNEYDITNEDLNIGLIEYYTLMTSKEFNIEINERPDLLGKVKIIDNIHEKLNDDLDKLAFNSTYVTKENVSLIYENGEQYIKYVDENGNEQLIKSIDSKKTTEKYKKLLEENLKASEIFEILTKEDNKETYSKEVNMLDYINENNTNNEMAIETSNSDNTNNNDEIVFNEVVKSLNNNEKEEFVNVNTFTNIEDESNKKIVQVEENEFKEEENSLSTIKNFRDRLENTKKELTKEDKDNQSDFYMVFYLIAIAISIGLIIGIIILKFYS